MEMGRRNGKDEGLPVSACLCKRTLTWGEREREREREREDMSDETCSRTQ